MNFQVTTLRDPERPGNLGIADAVSAIEENGSPGSKVWGLFTGLIGLRSNEAYLVTSGDSFTMPPGGLETVAAINMTATVRPTSETPPDQPGIYVFRWFDIIAGSVDEIVSLSDEAWKSFEVDFDAQIQGLFAEDSDDPQRMLLVTRYRDLSVWEASRQPAPNARENFLKRHRLTKGAFPVATLLHGKGLELVSHQ